MTNATDQQTAARSRHAPGRVVLAAVVAISLAVNVGGWVAYNRRGSGLGLATLLLMIMLIVMVTAVAGALVVWFWRKPGSSLAQLIFGAALAVLSVGLLGVNSWYLWTTEVCRTCV
ncbi:hypothetical protein [Flexivirga sp. B27]